MHLNMTLEGLSWIRGYRPTTKSIEYQSNIYCMRSRISGKKLVNFYGFLRSWTRKCIWKICSIFTVFRSQIDRGGQAKHYWHPLWLKN